MQLPQAFNSDVCNGMTGRVKVLGYRLAEVVADVSQMLRKRNREGPGCLTNIDEVTRLTGDGIYQVVALTHESPLDRHVTIGTSNGGVSAQKGACLATVSGSGECAWCGVGMTTEAGVYENLTSVPVFHESHQRPITKGRANCSAVWQTGRLCGW